MLLSHLVDDENAAAYPLESAPFVPDEFVECKNAHPDTILDAKRLTAQILQPYTSPQDPVLSTSESNNAVAATLAARLTPATGSTASHTGLLTHPDSVQRAYSVLSAYDWDFVIHASRIRTFLVSQLLTDAQSADSRIRLRATEMLGKVSEVGLFTERTGRNGQDLSDVDIDERIKSKLASLLGIRTSETIEPKVRNPEEDGVDDEIVRLRTPTHDHDS